MTPPIAANGPRERAPVAPERRRLGDVLLERGLLTPAELASALAAQGHARDDPTARRRRLGRVVVELGLATERQVAEALANLLGLDVVDLAREPVSPETARLLPRQVADRGRVLVLSRTATGGLRVATADPTNVVALDDVRLYTNATELTVVVATESQIRDQIARLWSLSEESADVTTMIEEIGPDHADDPEPAAAEADAAPTVRLVSMILADAVRQGASDIHVEPQRDCLRIRYRIDGMLRDVMTVPRAAASALVSRVKIISGLDIAERRVPQDGRARLSVDGVFVDARVSSLPSLHGEKVVLRLLARADAVPSITRLGLDDRQLEATLSALGAPQGLVLITGPTGSGKTNTLYAAISRIQTPERNIVTLEDPVEIQLAGITQVQVHEKSGLTFARGLRSILRQDPDIVLVGEVRDRETAQLALQASLTGHLVLTTLHTNDAISALTRLVDMGVEPFLVASSLALVVAQRLVRRPCPNCAVPSPPPPRVLAALGLVEEDLAGASPVHGRGCVDCGNSGYRGRVGIFEVLPVTAALRQVLLRTPTQAAVAAAARAAGMVTLRASGMAKARRGETTFEELLRVTATDAVSAVGTSCRGCGRPIGPDMLACPWCGGAVDETACAGCARPLDPDWRTCPWCRTPAGRSRARPGAAGAGSPGA